MRAVKKGGGAEYIKNIGKSEVVKIRRIFDHKKDTCKDVKSVLIGNILISLLMLIIAIDNFGLDSYAVFTSLGIIAYTAVSSIIVLDVVKNKPVRGNASDKN